MTTPAIQVEQLGKRYRLGQRAGGRRTLGETVASVLRAPWQRLRSLSDAGADGQDTFWALRDVSFTVAPGQVVGIVGSNGAGKSTLLKVLSRIVEPTSGRAVLRGSVRSLLEVGTGFHPELTGRENIYLNGAILGMKKTEIDRQFDAIVAFAEIERFLDTPVKRYSSGMYVRLAFAVAAHLQPEILIVDEVLAVGDAAFQAKCLGTMGRVASEGRTILFVSHNMAAVQQLCQRVLLLQDGQIHYDGGPREGIHRYLGARREAPSRVVFAPDASQGAALLEATVLSPTGGSGQQVESGEPCALQLRYVVRQWQPGLYVCVAVENEWGTVVLWSSDVADSAELDRPRAAGTYSAIVRIPGELVPGAYTCSAAICVAGRDTTLDFRPRAVAFEVRARRDDLLGRFGIDHPALTAIPVRWSTEFEGRENNQGDAGARPELVGASASHVGE